MFTQLESYFGYFRPVKFISIILRRIWCAWFFLVGASSFILLYPLFFILLRKRSWFRYAFRLKKVWAHIMLFGSGIFYKIKKEGVIDPKRSYVICPNHTSYLDIVLTNIAFSNYFHFMGKAELQTIPLFNIFFKRMNIPVDRTSITSSHKAFNRAKQDIAKGISIAIYPEGTIPESAPDLGPFKNGAFKLAIEMQIPIVPITYLDNWKIFPDKKGYRYLIRPGLSRVIRHKAIETKGMGDSDVSALRQQVHDLIKQTLISYGSISSPH